MIVRLVVSEMCIIDRAKTVKVKNKDRQNRICHNVAPSKDLTNNPPKLKLNAPKKINNGPGKFLIKVIKFVKLNFASLSHIV